MTPQEALEKVNLVIEQSRASASDGISVAEFSEITMNVVRTAVQVIDSVPADGAEKKDWVLQAVGVLFDAIADKMVPIYGYPLWIVLKPAVRMLILAAASGAIESILPVVRALT